MSMFQLIFHNYSLTCRAKENHVCTKCWESINILKELLCPLNSHLYHITGPDLTLVRQFIGARSSHTWKRKDLGVSNDLCCNTLIQELSFFVTSFFQSSSQSYLRLIGEFLECFIWCWYFPFSLVTRTIYNFSSCVDLLEHSFCDGETLILLKIHSQCMTKIINFSSF